MTSQITSATLLGVDGYPVQVEVDLQRKLPCISIVGLPDGAVRESADRVRSAIQHSQFDFPRKRVVVNLAPAGIRKSGTVFDLPIAIGIIIANLPKVSWNYERINNSIFVGELSLSGDLRGIRGSLSFSLMAQELKFQYLIVPKSNHEEASIIEGVSVLGFSNLYDVVQWLQGQDYQESIQWHHHPMKDHTIDMADVKGQNTAKRALEIAAAGGHNILLMGPPGCGKTMMAKRLSTILPSLQHQEAIDITRIHSAAGIHQEQGLISVRPFRSPHHSTSSAGMIGNAKLLPGEVSLAHNGVLFLDEIAEFRQDALEALRTPLEDGQVHITRASGKVSFPANFVLIAAANPCPCGWKFHPTTPCSCTPMMVQRYQNKLSGPLLDRIDIHIWLHPIPAATFFEDDTLENSKSIQQRVEKARQIQTQRFDNKAQQCNADLEGDDIWQECGISPTDKKWLLDLCIPMNLSGRALGKLLKVARTIADLENRTTVEKSHLAEAFSYKKPLIDVE